MFLVGEVLTLLMDLAIGIITCKRSVLPAVAIFGYRLELAIFEISLHRTGEEVDEVIQWLTGFDDAELRRHLAEGTTFEDFFADARLNPRASQITGVICSVRVEGIEDPLMQQIRYLDKLVDELAKGKPMEKVLMF